MFVQGSIIMPDNNENDILLNILKMHPPSEGPNLSQSENINPYLRSGQPPSNIDFENVAGMLGPLAGIKMHLDPTKQSNNIEDRRNEPPFDPNTPYEVHYQEPPSMPDTTTDPLAIAAGYNDIGINGNNNKNGDQNKAILDWLKSKGFQ